MSSASSITSRLRRPEEVHLEQSDLLDRLHRELGHGPEHPLAVLVGPGVRDLERHDVGQRPVGDHDRGGVDRGVPHDSLEALSHLDDLLGDRVPVDLGAQRLTRLEAVLEARRTAHDRVGDQLGQAIAGTVVVAEHTGGVARRRAREHLAERDDLRHRLLAVLVGHIPDHALTTADREVDVDIRHRHALGVQETLEQQAVAKRIDVGDLERVRDQRPGGRAAARTDRDPRVLGVLDEVPHDQEVAGEAHPLDHVELVVRALERLRRHRIAVALAHPLPNELAYIRRLALAVRRRVARNQLTPQLELDVAALGDLERGRDRLGPLRERLCHLVAGAKIELVGVEADLGLIERRLRLHAQQRRVMAVVLATQVVDVARPDQRPAQLARDLDDPLVGLILRGEAVLLDLEVHVVGAERLDQLIRMGPGLRRPAVEQVLAEARLQAPGEHDHALGVGRQLREIDRRLAALVALEEPGRAQLDQVAVANRRRRQQGQVEAIQPARRAALVVVDNIRLAAQNRLDVLLAGSGEELYRPVHYAVVGESECRLVERRGPLDQGIDLARTVE